MPTILLDIRATWREDLGATPAELVYGKTLRLPGQFLSKQPMTTKGDTSHLITTLRHQFANVQLKTQTMTLNNYLFSKTASHVFVRHDGPKSILQPPYDGPFPVLKTNGQNSVQIHGKNIDVSIDRIKPAYLLAEPDKTAFKTSTQSPGETENPAKPPPRTTRSGRRVRFLITSRQHLNHGFLTGRCCGGITTIAHATLCELTAHALDSSRA